jgi:hypothetical protein
MPKFRFICQFLLLALFVTIASISYATISYAKDDYDEYWDDSDPDDCWQNSIWGYDGPCILAWPNVGPVVVFVPECLVQAGPGWMTEADNMCASHRCASITIVGALGLPNYVCDQYGNP